MAIAAVIGAGGLGLLLLNGISGSDIRMLIAGRADDLSTGDCA
ncbi:Uncharacterised protein [Salmonella enterica subsp. arizonae]|nr:Uncharacterised protein [Salmonella enterica subsp. arizonae]